MNPQILESATLFILLLNLFRSYFLLNVYLLLTVCIPLFLFIILSFDPFFTYRYTKSIRFLCLFLIIILLMVTISREYFIYRLRNPSNPYMHDSVMQTELVTSSFLEGKNPYSITFEKVLKGKRFYFGKEWHPVLKNYVYSPVTFLVNVPFHLITTSFLSFTDSRVALLFFFFFTGVVGSVIVRKKMLFLILFFLNPLFLRSLFIGTNDILVLFFFFLCIGFLKYKKYFWASVFLAIAVGTKLIIAPFIPLYFLYLFQKLRVRKDRYRYLIKQFLLFLVILTIIYLPFFVWDPQALTKSLILFPLAGGNQSYPITGIIGVPQLLTQLGAISSRGTFPFYLFEPIIIFPLLLYANFLFRKSPKLSLLCATYIVIFAITFAFSRVFQPNYLDFLSQILVLAVFVDKS